MGGYGSGWRWERMTQIEECRFILSAARLQSLGILGANRQGTYPITWTNRDGEDIGGGAWEIDVRTARDPNDWHISIIAPGHPWGLHMVHLTTTTLPWDGLRWWFYCPMRYTGPRWRDSEGRVQQHWLDCDRRVGKLYLKPGTNVFGCRRCHNLSYWSRQTSAREDRLWKADVRLIRMIDRMDREHRT